MSTTHVLTITPEVARSQWEKILPSKICLQSSQPLHLEDEVVKKIVAAYANATSYKTALSQTRDQYTGAVGNTERARRVADGARRALDKLDRILNEAEIQVTPFAEAFLISRQ